MRLEIECSTAEAAYEAIKNGDYPVITGDIRISVSTNCRIICRGSRESSQPHVEARESRTSRESSQPHVEAWESSQPHVEAWESSQPHVVAWGSSQPHVEARESSQPHVEAWESSQPHVVAWGSSQRGASSQPHVEARESSQPHVEARESSQPHVEAWESSQPHVVAWESSQPHVEAWESSQPHVEAWESSQPHVVAWGSSQPHVEAWESSQPHVEAWESSQPHVVAWGSSQPHVEARESSQPHVEARESSQPHVVAWGSSQPHVVAWGSSQPHVEASGHCQVSLKGAVRLKAAATVAVFVMGTLAVVEGGGFVQNLAIDTPEKWCEHYGVEVTDGHAVLFKALDAEFRANYNGFQYLPGATQKASDWDPNPERECGGGLHFSPSPRHAQRFHPRATRFAGVRVKIATLLIHPDGESPDKCRGPETLECFEVDIRGKRIEAPKAAE
jgi:hypothetical protein